MCAFLLLELEERQEAFQIQEACCPSPREEELVLPLRGSGKGKPGWGCLRGHSCLFFLEPLFLQGAAGVNTQARYPPLEIVI